MFAGVVSELSEKYSGERQSATSSDVSSLFTHSRAKTLGRLSLNVNRIRKTSRLFGKVRSPGEDRELLKLLDIQSTSNHQVTPHFMYILHELHTFSLSNAMFGLTVCSFQDKDQSESIRLHAGDGDVPRIRIHRSGSISVNRTAGT